jgi:Mg2+ and Co2+ transporter CorA
MLIRVAYEYSELVWNKDDEYVKSLTKLITLFSSWYYFNEISTRSEGKELAKMFRQSYNIENLFKEVNTTLHELYRNQESVAADRMNLLLFTLTIFTVVSGIYGMNLVIPDWEQPFRWTTVMTYTFFEWISLLTALSGIGLSVFLVITTMGNLFWKKLRMKKSNSHM